MKRPDDVLYIYNNETGDNFQVIFTGKSYVVNDLMQNGFFEKVCTFDDLIEILSMFSDSDRNPLEYGMVSFG